MKRALAGLRGASLQIAVAAAILAGAAALRIIDPDPIARLRASVFDAYVRASPRDANPEFPVRIVAIDEASLAKIGQWPWPRTRIAEIVSKLSSAGAKAIAFDIMFAEPDRLSPRELARALEDRKDMKPIIEGLAGLPSNDAQLAEQIAVSLTPVVVGVAGDANGQTRIEAPRASFAFAGDDPKPFVHAFPGAVATLEGVRRAASGVGAVNWLPAGDQIVRRAPMLLSIAGELYPSLALETLRTGAGQSTIFIKSSGASGAPAFGQKTGVESVRVGDIVVPTDGRGELWLKFSPADPRRTLSAHAVLDGAFDPELVRGRHVFIGATAAGLLDVRATPLDAAMPGVEVHAQALEQMLSGVSLTRPAYATGLELSFLVIAGAIATWLMTRSGAVAAALAVAGAVAAIALASAIAHAAAGALFDPVYPALALAALYLGVSLSTYVRSETDRAKIRSAFSHYVAPTLVEELARNHDKLKLGGETRVVTLLFADVRGFSRLSEGFGAEELVRFVNRLFTPLTETILKNRGTIDKFMGDAVMAFWNAPADDADHARNACRAALRMLDDVARLNGELASEARATGAALAPVRLGIGLNSGACVVGNVGSPERFDYSVLGDVVNVASRFEDETKAHGADIIVGETTAAAACGFAFLEIGEVTPRGKDRAEKIFALIGDDAFAATSEFAELASAHQTLKTATADAATEALETCRRLAPPAIARRYERPLARDASTKSDA